MEALRPGPSFDLNSEENRAARALFSNTVGSYTAAAPSGTTTRPSYTSSSGTSANDSTTAVPPTSFWGNVCGSDEEDTPPSTSAAIPPPAPATAPATSTAPATADYAEDSDPELFKFFALKNDEVADLPSPSTRPSTSSGSPVQANGSIGANGASSSGGSPGGSSAGKKRRREGTGGAASADRTPPPPRRSDLGSDSDSSSGDGDGDGDDDDNPRRKVTGHRRSKAPSSRHRNHGAACGRSPRRSSSPAGDDDDDHADDEREKGGSDPDCDDSGGGRGIAAACRPKKKGGRDGMQVEFDCDSDSDSDAGSDFGGGGQEAAIEEEEEEEEDGDADEHDDADLKKLKPTLSAAPFTDTEMKPLVLTNEAAGQRAEVPASLNRYLKDYQKEGVKFLFELIRHTYGPMGAILGDDMGLGKTVQIMALLAALFMKKGTGQDLKDLKDRKANKEHASAAGKPVLIVCPTQVRDSWEKHLKDWGHFESRSIRTKTNGRGSLQSVESLLRAGRLEVVVTGQTMFKNSVDTLKEFDWLAIVFDEVHNYKNPKTKLAKAVNEMDKAEVLIGLTGTLVQNSLTEVWNVMNMIQPGCLKTLDHFKAHFEKPYLQGRKSGASRADCLLAEERLKEFFPLRDKVLLRREKSILGNLLKGKTGTVVFCDLTEVQKLVYRTVLALPEFRLLATANEPCPCGRVDAKSGSCCGVFPMDESSEDLIDPKAVLWRRFHPNLRACDKGPGCPYCCAFSAISKLQKLANHPCLLQVKPIGDYEGQQQKMRDDIAFAQVAFSEQAIAIMTTRPGDHDGAGAGAGAGGWRSSGGGGAVGGGESWDRRLARPENFLQLCRDDTCGKMRTLKVLLKRFQNKDKVLLFSYSTAMLDILQTLCSSEGYTFLRLDGNTAKDQRPKMIQRFGREDAFDSNIFLISTKAGGTGLNLQSANKVILYDVNWNPAQDAQAEDRAYRIGQLRDVEVFRLVSTGTIEELTYMRQIYKLQTSAATLGDKSEGGLRQFEGVQGDSSQQGELWGLSNLMKFSGESMLLKLRQEHGHGLPPLVRDSKDGLLMEPQENIVDVVTNYAAAENTGDAEEDAQDPQPGGGEEEEEEDEKEEEFDDAGWGGGGSGGGAGGAGAEPVNENAELGGVVMLHDEMVAADKVEELPPGTQESGSLSINEVEMMDDDETDDEAMDDAMDDAMDANGGGGAAAAAASPPAADDGLAAAAALGRHGGVGAPGATPRLVNHAPDNVNGGDGDGGSAGGQVKEEEEQAAGEPSWALLPTQEPNDAVVHEQQELDAPSSSSPMVSASSPSTGETNAGNPGGLSGGGTRSMGGGGGSVPGDGSAAGNSDSNSAAAGGDDASSQVEAGGGAAARGRNSGVPSQFLYAPAAQDVLGVFDYADGGEEKETREEKEEEEEAEEDETGTPAGGTGGAEEAHEGSDSAGSSSSSLDSLDLEIPLTDSTNCCDGGNDGGEAGAGGVEQPGNDGSDGSGPAGGGANPEQEDVDSSSELELALSNSEDVSFSAETQPPPGFV